MESLCFRNSHMVTTSVLCLAKSNIKPFWECERFVNKTRQKLRYISVRKHADGLKWEQVIVLCVKWCSMNTPNYKTRKEKESFFHCDCLFSKRNCYEGRYNVLLYTARVCGQWATALWNTRGEETGPDERQTNNTFIKRISQTRSQKTQDSFIRWEKQSNCIIQIIFSASTQS